MPRQKPSSCIGCALHSHGTDFSAVTGTGSLGVMIVAEASGEHEQREGIPLVPYAPAGSLLERTFKRMGLSREQFVLTNCLRCFPGHVVVEATHVVNGFRRWYGGELVTIETDEGVLSGTPNHPALTNYGWIPLGLLQEGDYLIRGSVPERVTCRDPHIDWDSTRLDETFNSLANNWGSCGVIGSDMDFHGDGEDSEVDVVCPDRLLWDGDYLPILQKVTESALKTAHLKGCVKHGFGSGLCGPSRLFGRDATATDGIVSSLRNGLTSYKSRVPQSYYHGLATVAWPDAQSDKTLSGGLWTDAELYREALQTFSRDVTCSQIRKIERGAFSGHVYNLHTASEVYTANGFVVHNCRPKNNWLSNAPWEYSALRHCRPNLDAAIANRRPRAILAMGDVALRELTGLAGDARGIGHLTGYVLPQANFVEFKKESVDAPIPVIPAFHPAFIRRGKASYQGQFARCLSRAVNVASGKDHHYIWDLEEAQRDGRIRYQVHPSLDQARSFAQRVADNRGLTLSYDIETFESASLDEDARDGFTDTRIRLIQFSLEAGTGIAFPWDGEYRELAGRILRTDNVKCGHNLWLFDNKVLRAAGEREGLDLNPRGTIHDTLQMFHHWQPDLPAHLQFAAQFVQFPFPWKHLAGTDLEFYGCVDVDATLRLDNFLLGAMQRDQIWEGAYEVNGNCTGGYVGQMAQVRPVLAGMEDRGLPVDDAVRLGLDKEFESAQLDLLTELDGKFPDSARSIHPKEGYKKVPKDTTGMCLRAFESPDMDAAGNPTMISVERWCRLEQFSPNSSQQLIRYMKAKGHKIPKSRKSENEDGSPKDTTEKKELVRLAQRHSDSFYLKVIEYRELGKMRGTYIDGFKPHEDGRVHTTFTFDTGTGQLTSRNPNIQNFVKHGRLAKPVRAMIAAPEGYELAEFDYKAYHVLTTGYCAEDPDYMRFARLDMHSFVAGHFLHCWDADRIRAESDDELRVRFAWFKQDADRKRVRDKQAKPSILGIGFGMGYRRLYQENLEHFEGEKQAKKFHDLLHFLFPKVFAWQDVIRKQAHEQTFLRSPFGHIRRFYEVFRWDSARGGWAPGDQAEEAVAFLPANIAFGNIRETMKELERQGISERFGLVNNIHDSVLFCYPRHLRDELLAVVPPVLTAPSKVLIHPIVAPEGLSVETEANVGPDWAHMQEVKLGPLAAGRLPQDVTLQDTNIVSGTNAMGVAGR